MSVYTPVSLMDAQHLLTGYAIGEATQISGITEGVVNSNFRLSTTTGQYILTLVENPEHGKELPWLITLLDQLAATQLPTPRPVRDQQGLAIHPLHGKASLLVTLLPGVSPQHPTPHQCRQIGETLARIHTLPRGKLEVRDNPMGIARWYLLLHQLTTRMAAGELRWLQEELGQAKLFFANPHLPTGLCHADLFPDNSLFQEEQLTGVIDFHFACHDKWLYDLAISINAWCFRPDGTLDDALLTPLWQGYQRHRQVTDLEIAWLDQACRTASLRFALTRLVARWFPKAGATVTCKPPEEYLNRLQFHRDNSIRQWITR
ncbi:MAG: homoserine kinase [Magnetococcales bacterium]|nr:homoserine kinase [Magnetococcales bacterium]NGZ25544.1 homoserine kinase [Magnetococcales bacterium]